MRKGGVCGSDAGRPHCADKVDKTLDLIYGLHIFVCLYCFVFCIFRAAPTAYGASQARGHIRAEAANLHHSHSNAGSKPCLRPTPQLTATTDP